MKLARILAIILAAGASACAAPIILHYPATPHFYGRIIDTESKQPIDGARVVLKEYPDWGATMAPGGYFDVAGVEREFPQPVILGALDLPVPSGTLIFEAEGYRRLETNTLHGEEISDLTIELERL